MNISTSGKPRKKTAQQAIIELGLQEQIEAARTVEQRRWQVGVENYLCNQGIHPSVASYMAEHSLYVETAQQKARDFEQKLEEMGLIKPFPQRVW